MRQKLLDFVKRDIWRIRAATMPRSRFFLLKNLRIAVLALRGFDEDRCALRSSALTFYTLLSIVPLFAMAFGIAKGFGFEQVLEQQLLDKFPMHQDVIGKIITFARNMLDHTRGGVVGGIGLIVLFWSVVQVLSHIETSLNDIWGVKSLRSFGRRLSDYLSLMLVCPLFLIVSSGVTVFIRAQAHGLAQRMAGFGAMGPALGILLAVLPYAVVWAAFVFVYLFIPNTKVRWRSGLVGGILAGTVYQAVQMVYVTFQVGVGKYNAIYGSFAALPLFLVWVQLSWRIVLFGAEVSFAHQNVETYEYEPDCLRVSRSFRRRLTLAVAALVAKAFAEGQPPLTATRIAARLELPVRLLRDIVNELVVARVVSEIKTGDDRVTAYQPGFDVNQMTIKQVLDRLDASGSDAIPVAPAPELDRLSGALKELDALAEHAPANRLLKDV